MTDKSLSIFLMVLFGASGIAILMLAWTWPMPTSERIMTTFIGSAGFFTALIRALSLRPLRAKTDAEQGTVKVEVEDGPQV